MLPPMDRQFYSIDSLVVNKSHFRTPSAEERDKLVRYVADSVIGRGKTFSGPFGLRQVLYLDYIASGRALSFLEDYIRDEVLPEYGNTHTTNTVTSLQTTLFRHEARDIIRNAVNASEHDSVIFTGNGCTGAIHKLIHALKLTQPPVVFVGPYEHHSNLLPWKETGAVVVRIKQTQTGQVDITHLEQELQAWSESGRQRIGSFSAASNVTGILADVDAITICLHRHGALAFWDYATAAPYVKLDMNPVVLGKDSALVYKDAMFISPHKFVGGVASTGVLVAKKKLFKNVVPDEGGGGTVFFVRREGHRYLREPELREEGGTPAIVGAIRAGLVFQLKATVTPEVIMAQEQQLFRRACEVWRNIPSLVILGCLDTERLPVFSFLIHHPESGLFLHHNFVMALLNDLFGIQARGGCACAGPYAMDLLGITEEKAREIENLLAEDGRLDRVHLRRYTEYSHREIIRPGFTRLNLPYFMQEEELEFVLQAVAMVAKQGWKLLPQYMFNPETGEWRQRDQQVFKERKWLGYISYAAGCMEYTVPKPQAKGPLPVSFQDCLEKACELITKAEKSRTKLPDHAQMFDEEARRYRWFLLPSEASQILSGNMSGFPYLPNELPFFPGLIEKSDSRSESVSENCVDRVNVVTTVNLKASEQKNCAFAVAVDKVNAVKMVGDGEEMKESCDCGEEGSCEVSDNNCFNLESSLRSSEIGSAASAQTETKSKGSCDCGEEDNCAVNGNNCCKLLEASQGSPDCVGSALVKTNGTANLCPCDSSCSELAPKLEHKDMHIMDGAGDSLSEGNCQNVKYMLEPASAQSEMIRIGSSVLEGNCQNVKELPEQTLSDKSTSVLVNSQTPVYECDDFRNTVQYYIERGYECENPPSLASDDSAETREDIRQDRGDVRPDGTAGQLQGSSHSSVEGQRPSMDSASLSQTVPQASENVGKAELTSTDGLSASEQPPSASSLTHSHAETFHNMANVESTSKVRKKKKKKKTTQQKEKVEKTDEVDTAEKKNIKKAGHWIPPPKEIFKPSVKAMEEFSMVQNGDHVLVCLSGGKDSLSLLHTIHQYQYYCKSKGISFDLGAVTVDPQTPSYDPSPLKDYLAVLGVPYFYESQCIMETAVNLPYECASICSFCSRMKRGRIYAAARREGYNVLALGQHLDDLAESFIMSLFHNGSLRTMKANYTVQEGDLRVIRPFVFVRERDLRNFAEKNKLPVIAENCPACFEAPKERHRTKQLLASQEILFPCLYNSILTAIRPVMARSLATNNTSDFLTTTAADNEDDFDI